MRKATLVYLCVLFCTTLVSPASSEVIYRNPRVYNVDYSFELIPDPAKIDRAKDLKLLIPIPREWDSQKAVKIISVQPPPHAEYEDAEHGNRMFFWDFGREPEKPSYKVDMKFRLESYEIHAELDPNNIATYDKTSKEYELYTRSSHTICITPNIKEMAEEAIGDETNPYLQTKRIFDFVRKKMRYKILDYERGRGIKCLLDYPVKDEKTGEEYYEGCCSQYTAFFCALCRAAGIPARAVFAFMGGWPWIGEEQLKPLYKFETKLSPGGLAGVQHFGNMYPHMWAEFLLPDYGWIPADAQKGRFGHLTSRKVILNKGRDIQIGPHASQGQSEGYGSQWVLLHNGRADFLFSAVWNIGNVHTAKVKVLHHSDPFPADAFADYQANLYPKAEAEKKSGRYRKQALARVYEVTRGEPEKRTALAQAYKEKPRLRCQQEPFICHMLRKVVGDRKFFRIFKTYEDLRVNSGEPVSTKEFQKLAENVYGEPLDWFFNQWLRRTELPQLKLDRVIASEHKKGWHIRGNIRQLSDSLFRLPVELALTTGKNVEHKRIWLEKRNAVFDFDTPHQLTKILVDPDNDILKIQKMPPLLGWFWNLYPDLIVIYGTLAEAEANKTAAERFNSQYLGLGDEIIKADTEVKEDDLKTKCVFLFGRPETNKIAQQFKDVFPIKFDQNKFTWQGVTYDQPTQGVAQIIENPHDPKNLSVLCAGLSGDATQKFCDLRLYDANISYVIFDGDKPLVSGDWKVDSDLCWNLDANGSPEPDANGE